MVYILILSSSFPEYLTYGKAYELLYDEDNEEYIISDDGLPTVGFCLLKHARVYKKDLKLARILFV